MDPSDFPDLFTQAGMLQVEGISIHILCTNIGGLLLYAT